MKIPAAFVLSLAVLAACDQPKPRGQAAAAKVEVEEALPPAPQWAAAYVGKPLREVFPQDGTCLGNTDLVEKHYGGAPAGVAIVGWGWDDAGKKAVERVVLVDASMRIVGAGEAGLARPDVPAANSEITSPTTGWRAHTPMASGAIDAYGVTNTGKGVCRLGHLEFYLSGPS